MQRHRYLPVVVAASLVLALPAHACNVPVFRYALERWAPDAYEAVLFHDGELTPELMELMRRLRPTDERGRPVTNLRLTAVDLRSTLDEATQSIWKSQFNATAPWLVVRYPKALMLDNPLWSGKADRAAVDILLQSPARSELTRRLLAGHSTVWIVIESGDANQDQTVIDTLGRELTQLQTTVKLPDESAQPGGVLKLPMDQGEGVLSKVPLRIEFSVLRVKRGDAREGAFLANVLQTDAGLAAEQGTIVLPVFGRGRALQAFPAEVLDAATIAGVEEFLCGACSCSVKTLNPGMDLLLTANWETALGTEAASAETELVETDSAAVTLVAIPPGRQPSDAARSDQVKGPRTVVWAAVTIAGILIGVASMLTLRVREHRTNF